jgi:hypothetical protein
MNSVSRYGLHSTGVGLCQMAGFCVNDNKCLDYITVGNILVS